MVTRSEVFRRFGPFLNEAMMLVILEEVNVLRSFAGKPPRTEQQMLDQLGNHSTSLEPYDWMKEE
ncbi:hypothetical protein ES703_21033 [subsurface metagenome]